MIRKYGIGEPAMPALARGLRWINALPTRPGACLPQADQPDGAVAATLETGWGNRIFPASPARAGTDDR